MFEEEKNNLDKTNNSETNNNEKSDVNTQENGQYRYTKESIIDNQNNNVNNGQNGAYQQNGYNNSYGSNYNNAGQNASYQNAEYQNNAYWNAANQNTSYSNNIYQNDTYQNNAYQNNPYQNNSYQYGGYQNNSKPTKAKKEKKSGGWGKRIVAIVLSAVLFGTVAGGTMYGVYYTGVKYGPQQESAGNVDVDIPTVSTGITSSAVVSDSTEGVTATMNVSAVAKAAMPAMVALQGTTTVSSGSYYGGFGQSYQATTSGTGIIVGKNDTELLILTNAHVIDEVNNLECLFVDGEKVSATVKGSKSDKDIAVVAVTLSQIKSSTLENIAIAELGSSEDVVIGQDVVAIGNALGEGQSVTNGIISALDREITVDNITFTGLFMTNAAINSGNSGGALLNADGKVIGINFAKTSEDGVEGMAYSIPVSNVKELIDSLMNRETRQKVSDAEASYLGVSGVDITSTMASYNGYPQGLQIRSVVSGSAADRAGLSKYDIIVGFDDQTVSSMSGLQSIMQYYKAGETVEIKYYHIEGSRYVLKTTDVTLDAKNK